MLLDEIKALIVMIDKRTEAQLLLVQKYRNDIIEHYRVYVDLTHDIRFEDEKVIVLHPQGNKEDKFSTLGSLISCIANQLDVIVNQCRELTQIRERLGELAFNIAGDLAEDTPLEEEQAQFL